MHDGVGRAAAPVPCFSRATCFLFATDALQRAVLTCQPSLVARSRHARVARACQLSAAQNGPWSTKVPEHSVNNLVTCGFPRADYGSAMPGSDWPLALDDLATSLVSSSVTHTGALYDSDNRRKLLPLNPRELSGNRARRRRGVSRAARVKAQSCAAVVKTLEAHRPSPQQCQMKSL